MTTLRRRNVGGAGSGGAAGNNASNAGRSSLEEDDKDASQPLLHPNPPRPMIVADNTSYISWLQTLLADIFRRCWAFLWGDPLGGAAIGSNAPSSPAVVSPQAKAVMDEMRQRVRAEPFDTKNPSHEADLMELWRLAFPDEQLSARVSKEWGRLGFQGTDPATDFRGSGHFGLRNLLYFGRNYPLPFRRLVRGPSASFYVSPILSSSSSSPSSSSSSGDADGGGYPFAITGLNLTNLIFELLGWGMRPADSPARARLVSLLIAEEPTKEEVEGGGEGGRAMLREGAFEEIYCAVFRLFDRRWREMKASYMDFPRVMTAVKSDVESFLLSTPTVAAVREENRKEWGDLDLISM